LGDHLPEVLEWGIKGSIRKKREEAEFENGKSPARKGKGDDRRGVPVPVGRSLLIYRK